MRTIKTAKRALRSVELDQVHTELDGWSFSISLVCWTASSDLIITFRAHQPIGGEKKHTNKTETYVTPVWTECWPTATLFDVLYGFLIAMTFRNLLYLLYNKSKQHNVSLSQTQLQKDSGTALHRSRPQSSEKKSLQGHWLL